MKDKLRNIVREMILAEMDEAKQGRISSNFVIVDADKATRLKDIFSNSNTHKWIADMIEAVETAGEAGLDRKGIIDALRASNPNYKLSTLNDETRSLIKSGVLSLGSLSRAKKEKSPSTGKRGRPSASPSTDIEDTIMETPLNESFIRMKKIAGII
jgi:hypothetical protein